MKETSEDKCPHYPMRWMVTAKTIMLYLVSSAAIATLVLVFHVWKIMKHMDSVARRVCEDTMQQTVEIHSINTTILKISSDIKAQQEAEANAKVLKKGDK